MSAKPDFSGVWLVDTGRSRLMSPAFARMLMRIEHREPDFVQTIRVDLPDGRKQFSAFSGGPAAANSPTTRRAAPGAAAPSGRATRC